MTPNNPPQEHTLSQALIDQALHKAFIFAQDIRQTIDGSMLYFRFADGSAITYDKSCNELFHCPKSIFATVTVFFNPDYLPNFSLPINL